MRPPVPARLVIPAALSGCNVPALLAIAATLSGCNVLAGFSDLTVREDEPDPGAPGARPVEAFHLRLGDTHRQEVLGVAFDRSVAPSGGVVVTGDFRGSLALGQRPIQALGVQDAFAAKLDALGHPVWLRRFGESLHLEAGTNVAVDADGNVIVVRTSLTCVSATECTKVGVPALREVSLVKLNRFGKPAWEKSLGAGITVAAVAADHAGGILVTGSLVGSASLGGATLTSKGGEDVFVVKLDARGEHLWSASFGDQYPQSAESLAIDPLTDSVVVTGEFLGTIDFGGLTAPIKGAVGTNVFLVKLNADGEAQWSRSFGASLGNPAVAIDRFASVVLTGTLSEQVDFGGGPIASRGGFDVFVVKLDLYGDHVWSRGFAGTTKPCSDEGPDDPGLQPFPCSHMDIHVATDDEEAIALGGTFDDTLDLGGGTFVSAGGADVFAARLDKDGRTVWSQRFGDALPQLAPGVALDRGGNVILAGSFAGSLDFGSERFTSAGDYDGFVVEFSP